MADFQFFLNTQGLRGRTGAKGADGFAPVIAIGQNTLNTFTLLITTADGTFETPNLRGSIINNAGSGTFLRYDTETDSIYLSELPTASETEVGGVTIATDEELANAAGTGVVTADSMGVGIYGALKAGNNVSLSLDDETGLVTISSIDTKYILPVATTNTLGGVKPDGTTILVTEDGTISAVGGGQGTSNYEELTNKPTINTLELKGELELGGALKIERASTDAFYNSARNSSNQLTFSVASGYFTMSDSGSMYTYGTSGLVINNDGTITPSSYFMMPYKLGDILVYGKGASSYTYTTVLYGYKINGKFKPVLASSFQSGSGNNPYFTSFLHTYQRYSNTYYKNEKLYTSTTLSPDTTYKANATYPTLTTSSFYMNSLVYDESLGIYKCYFKASVDSFYERQYDTVMNEELQKVDTVIVLYRAIVNTAFDYSNFEIKDGSTVSGNFLTGMTYPEVMALPSVEIPEVIEHNVLSTGNIPNSYAGLDEKPKINGNELVGDINSTDLNIQRVMTPNGGINIVQNGDWHFFDASYDDVTKRITFSRYNLYTQGSNYADDFAYALNSTSESASKIGTYVDTEKIIPTCGVITPFYKNVTWKFGYSNYANCNRLIFGNYIDGYFYPKYAICPLNNGSTTSGRHFIKITSIQDSSTNVFSHTIVPVSITTTYKSNNYSSPVAFITILYDNDTYKFKYSHQNSLNNNFYNITATVTDDTEGLNSCTHCWHIPNNGDMGYSAVTQLATGDWSSDCFNTNMSNTKLNDALILPDSGSNVFTTSISVKTDGVTTKINESGELEAIVPETPIATTSTVGTVKPDGTSITITEDGTISSIPPANMITTDNIAADSTIQGLTTGKLDIDATSLSTTGKSTISALSFPSSRYIDLTLGSSGTPYYAPANGWLCFAKTSSDANQRIALFNTGSQSDTMIGLCAVSSAANQGLHVFVPAKKGDKIIPNYSVAGANIYFRFIYAEGSESEAE